MQRLDFLEMQEIHQRHFLQFLSPYAFQWIPLAFRKHPPNRSNQTDAQVGLSYLK